MELRPARIEDVPVLELSGLALSASTATPELLAIGDRRSVLVRTALTDGPLEWSSLRLDLNGGRDGQFERDVHRRSRHANARSQPVLVPAVSADHLPDVKGPRR